MCKSSFPFSLTMTDPACASLSLSVCLPAVTAEGLTNPPGPVGSVLDASPAPTPRLLSPGEEEEREDRPPPSAAAPTASSRRQISSSDGRKRSGRSGRSGGRWRRAAGMARRAAGSQTCRSAENRPGSRRRRSLDLCVPITKTEPPSCLCFFFSLPLWRCPVKKG